VSDVPMALRDEDVQRIGEYVKPWLRGYVAELVPAGPTPVQTQLLERMLHVEEELRLQRELIDERFETVDKRFDDAQRSFARMQWLIGIGFVMVTAAVTVFGILG
jgi:hypothetical protein